MEPTFAAPAHHDSGQERFNTYVKIAMILAVITGVEILIIFIPLAKWFVITTLVVLSLVKFLYVIFIFMHLRWDKVFCTILFFIGLVLAGGTMWALLALFGAESSALPSGWASPSRPRPPSSPGWFDPQGIPIPEKPRREARLFFASPLTSVFILESAFETRRARRTQSEKS